ncbi:shikimate kinase [Janibacter sp. GS2]|uniref:shikimate kinase n=1 Tax=Janibacter sp. GS2 TaxID=3442646 RepID=UPI003EC09B72
MNPAGPAPFVVVIGPPGVGKSTVARGLAERLGRRLVDTDTLVEEREGSSIADLFVEAGEEYFRDAERRAVIDSLPEDGIVLALGGGAPMTPAIESALAGHRVLFLDVGIADAAKRIGFDRARPLLAVNPRQAWIRAMDQRRPTYEGLARWRVDTAGRTAEEVVDAALVLLEEDE